MTIWQKILMALDDLTGGVFAGVLHGLFGLDLAAMRAERAEAEARRVAADADRTRREVERQEDVELREQQLAALLDLRADLRAWSLPEPGQIDSAIAAERRARQARIAAAHVVDVRSGAPNGLEPDEAPRLRLA